ncbi:hypothetical protein HMPREF1624_07754 [Sporothrix schenckii ATCC 58251]|uniref:Presequence translocated-associated motor subunit PAM17 n=1 Tax=Sporothrix schenckii (strain ATCC 58251 / de Perez 2211183) TaxID=1391915 RepID=U7PMD8_SPOS1|nr:hypothetical protein HMPREF1624_07754 [Sporothrix schenckii ATCC 58251]
MLTTTAPTLLRPGLAAASRTGSSLHRPAVAATASANTSANTSAKTSAKTSAAFLVRRPTNIALQSRTIVSSARVALPLKRKLASPPSAAVRRTAPNTPSSSSSFSSSSSASFSSSTAMHRPPPPTGATRNRDAAADAQAAARIAAATADAHASPKDLPPLDWNTFFALRKTRRRIQLAFSVAGGLTGGLAGGLFLGSGVAEPILSTIPLDPFLTLGLMTFGFATLGWLAGPSVGNVVFYAWKRPYKAQMTLKETQFFARIKRNRVDPTASSAGNPVPDFYGEKISSVAGYRQWLKDQRAFNKKRTTFV